MSGRRRQGQLYAAEDQALSTIHKAAENRALALRANRTEAHNIRMQELEKQKKELDADSTHDSKSYRSSVSSLPPVTSSASSARTGASRYTSTYGSRRGSQDIGSEGDRELRDKYNEATDKLKQAMLTNAQLDNEKSGLKFELENIKDDVEETEEKHISLVKEHRRKCTEHELLKRDFEKLQRDLEYAKYQLDERDRLIAEHNLVLVGNEKSQNDDDDSISSQSTAATTTKPKPKSALITKEAATILKEAGEGTLDHKLKKLSDEKQELVDQLHRLKLDFEEEKARNVGRDVLGKIPHLNGSDSNIVAAAQKEAAQKVNEYKLKLQKAEQDNSTLQATITRLEGQVKRYKTASEKSEASEEELKAEKRKLQRELREAQVKVDEVQNSYNHLQKRLEKLKQSKLAVISGGGKEE